MREENPPAAISEEATTAVTIETEELLPKQKEVTIAAHIMAMIIIVCGLVGLFNLIAKTAINLLGMRMEINEDIVRLAILSLLHLIVLVVFYWINRDKLDQYLIKRKLDVVDLLTIIGGIIVIIAFSYFLALVKLGEISWLPLNQWGETVFAALFYGITEELEFRSVLLVHLALWLNKVIKDEKRAEQITGIIIILHFGIVWHIRYILSGEYLLLGFILVFALFSTVYAVKRKRIVPLIILHVAMDFLLFLFIGGTINQL